MSISGPSASASSQSNSLSSGSESNGHYSSATAESGNSTLEGSSAPKTALEQLSSQPTTAEWIMASPTTAEQLSGQTLRLDAADLQEMPLQLAGGFMPDSVMQELEQQLQPLTDALEGALSAGTREPSAPTTPDTMTPAQLVAYWAGGGAENGDIAFGPNSEMSAIFSQGDGAAAFENFVYQKFDGAPAAGDTVDNFDYKFTAGRFFSTTNSAEHVIGSWQNGTATVQDDKIVFTIENVMGMDSLLAGRPLQDHFGLEGYGESESDLAMTITWEVPLRN